MNGINTTRCLRMRAILAAALVVLSMILPRPAAAEPEPLGGEFGYTLGGTTGPFDTELDLYANGTLNLPIYRSDPLFGQKLMTELMVGHARSRLDIPPTAVDGVTVDKIQITTFHIFIGFKYKFDKLGEKGSLTRRFQPYIIGGPLLNLFLCRTNAATCGGDPLPPELRSRGIPWGSGDVRFDYSFGGGLDYLLTDRMWIGADARHSFSSPRARYTLFGGRAGFIF
jgi:hypothetical protein